MSAIKKTLISFFVLVAQKDKTQLEKLKQESCFSVDQMRWCFTLPDLHLFLQHQYESLDCIEYNKFRKLIFSSPINQTVKLYDAEIIITDNQGKVDKSGYAMVWRVKNALTH
ncbi:MAG: hypothetical protein KAJ39_07660 [Gammaproteobacteria bacterium]|nr:hypothetical protein [Gammaproteobacteria bacterium]